VNIVEEPYAGNPQVRFREGCASVQLQYRDMTDDASTRLKKINFMYREKPHNDNDSGWKFFSGFESQDYIDNPSNTQIYDVNTIANYDPDIIPFLNAPIKSAFERNQETGKLEQIFDFEFPE